MESTMTNNIEKALEEVIKEIKESKEYQSCLELKSRMQKNEDLKRQEEREKESRGEEEQPSLEDLKFHLSQEMLH